MPVPYVGRASRAVSHRRATANPGPVQGGTPGAAGRLPDTGVFGAGVAGAYFEDFKSDYQFGEGNGFSSTSTDQNPSRRMSHAWNAGGPGHEHRPNGNGGTGTIYLPGSSNGLGLQGLCNGRPNGFGQGLFEYRVKMGSSVGGKGSGSGPAIVCWPADDVWITTSGYPDKCAQEVDVGELLDNGDFYCAAHYYDPSWNGGNAWWAVNASEMANPPPWGFWNDWHVYSVFLQRDRVTYFLDGNIMKEPNTWMPAPDYANGGLNHTLGIMNRSAETSLECDWVRWVPEAAMLAKYAGAATGGGTTGGGSTGGGGTTTPVARSISFTPKEPGTRPAGAWNTTLNIAGMQAAKWVVQNDASMNWAWETDAQTVVLPANGQAPIAPNFTLNGQFVLAFDANDPSFQEISGQVTIGAGTTTGGGNRTLNILLRGQSNAQLFADFGAAGTMRDRVAALTGRTVNLIASYGQSGDFTIYSGTEFIREWMNGTAAGPQENGILNYVGAQPASVRTAPFVELWLHNESDQKLNYSANDWVPVVRAEAALMRAKLGLSASQHLRYFVKVRYPYGNPTGIFAGMDQLAADASFNAKVSNAAYNSGTVKMNWPGDGNPENTDHMGRDDAFRLAEVLAQELAALYP